MASPAGRGLSTLRVITVELSARRRAARANRGTDLAGGASCAGGYEEPATARHITVGRCNSAGRARRAERQSQKAPMTLHPVDQHKHRRSHVDHGVDVHVHKIARWGANTPSSHDRTNVLHSYTACRTIMHHGVSHHTITTTPLINDHQRSTPAITHRGHRPPTTPRPTHPPSTHDTVPQRPPHTPPPLTASHHTQGTPPHPNTSPPTQPTHHTPHKGGPAHPTTPHENKAFRNNTPHQSHAHTTNNHKQNKRTNTKAKQKTNTTHKHQSNSTKTIENEKQI